MGSIPAQGIFTNFSDKISYFIFHCFIIESFILESVPNYLIYFLSFRKKKAVKFQLLINFNFVLQHYRIKNILTNSKFLLFLKIKNFFPFSRIFKDHNPNSIKDLQY